MLRFSQDLHSSGTSQTKSFTNNPTNAYLPQNIQKNMPLNLSQITPQKPHKKGITTIITHTLQNPKDQSQQKSPYTSRKSDSVFDQYIKTLQIQIASRERQRVELYRNLQEVKRENGVIFRDLNEQKKKSAGLQMKVDQMEIFLKQNEEKRKGLINEKQQLYKQFQFENQRRKLIEQNEQKLRLQFQSLQFESTRQVNQYVYTVNRINEQNKRFKQQTEKLFSQIRNLELNNESYKNQLNDVFLQKTKIIDSILIEKQFIEKQLHKQQLQHDQLKNVYKQKQETVKILNKRIMDLQQIKQSEKSQLTFQTNQMQLQNQNLKKNYEMAKQNFKRQLEALVNQGNRIRDIINQLQKDKKVDKSYINELERQIQQLQKQKSSQIQQKIFLRNELQNQRKNSQQQNFNFNIRIEHLETNLQQKSRQIQHLNKNIIELQSQSELNKYRNTTEKDLLKGQINFLKQQISAQSNQFTSESTKLIQQREKLQKYFNEELSKSKLQANQKLKLQKETLQKQHQIKLQDLKTNDQNQFKIFQNKIQDLKQQILRNNQHHILEKQKIIYQALEQSTRKLNIQQTNSLFQYQQMEGQLKKELNQKNSLIKSLTQQNKTFNGEITKLSSEISNLTNKLQINKEKYEIQEIELKTILEKKQSQFKEQILFQKKKSQLEKEQIKKQTDKTYSRLQSQIKHLQSQLKTLNKQKQQLSISLRTLQDSSLMSTSELRTQIMTLQLQKSQIQELLSLKQQQFTHQYGKFTHEINQKIHQHEVQKEQLQNYINSFAHSINSVIQFVQKYSGEVLKTNLIRLNCCQQSFYSVYQTSRVYCEQLTTFIGERLYAITVLMQENSEMKNELQTKNSQIIKLEQSFHQLTCKNTSLHQQLIKTQTQLSQLQKSMQVLNLQNNESIQKLKQHVGFYQKQLSQYELQFQQISTKIQERQGISLKSQTRIIQLQQEISLYKDEIQKLINKHKTQISSFIDKKIKQISLIQQQHQTHLNFLNRQFQQKFSLLQNQITSYQEKLKQLEKINDNKNHQYQELQNHFNLIIERLNQQHQTRVNQYQRQLQFIAQKINNSPNQQLLIKKIEILEDQLQKKQKQLKIVEENNALLRKNFINSLSEQQTLREEMKQNRSQNSATKSHSKQRSRKDTSQQLKNKYLLRKNSQLKITKQLSSSVNQMNMSLNHKRSYSNTQLNNRKYQTPRNSQVMISPLNLSIALKSEREIETQRPISNLQRSAPHVPLDLKKIRQRNQLYYHSQIPSMNKISSNEVKPQNSKSNSYSNLNLMTPIKMVQDDFPDIMIEHEQFPQNQKL